ncbi:MAG: NAD(P)-dependent oxidoreductase [bacterium]|nr:NAD(P)-dependent oxidoreductase [bacterium]
MSFIVEDCDFILKNAPCRWEKLAGAKIFITGGTGFFGKWFLNSFCHLNKKLRLDAKMTVLTRAPEKFLRGFPEYAKEAALSFTEGDVRDACFGEKYDFLIHAATPSDGQLDESNPEELYSIIVDGTRNIMKNAEKAGIKRTLYVSSGGVYGVQPSKLSRISETYVPSPHNVYGKGKLKSEEICFGGTVSASSARCFALVGPYQNLGGRRFAINSFIADAMKGGPIYVKDGRPYRSYLYAADLMIWLWTILLEGRDKETYNVGSSEAISIADLACMVAGCFTPEPCIINDTAQNIGSCAPAPRYVPDVTKASRELGLEQLIALPEAVKRAVGWHKATCRDILPA